MFKNKGCSHISKGKLSRRKFILCDCVISEQAEIVPSRYFLDFPSLIFREFGTFLAQWNLNTLSHYLLYIMCVCL